MNAPAVTVLLPVFNGDRHLRASVESVLRQRFADFELLVIDDGSTDDSPAVLRAFGDPRLRLLRHERNLGLVATLNRGLAEARGEWIARQDADDLSAPGRLAAQMAFVRGNPAVPLVGSDAWLIDDAGRPAGRWRTGGHADLVAWDLCFRAPFAHGSALFRRELVARRFGGYRDQPACEDLDLWARVAAEFPVVSLRSPLVKYRRHAASVMAAAGDRPERRAAVRAILAAHIAHVAPGLGEAERSLLTATWSGPLPADWTAYFDATRALRLGFSRGRRPAPGLARLIAEQHYALGFRARREGGVPAAARFLTALGRADRDVWWCLPWLRLAAATLTP